MTWTRQEEIDHYEQYVASTKARIAQHEKDLNVVKKLLVDFEAEAKLSKLKAQKPPKSDMGNSVFW